MNGLIIVCMGLIAMVGVICTVMYSRLLGFHGQMNSQREQLDRIEISLHSMVELQGNMQKRVDQLATDVHQREVYHGSDDRHQLAISDAKKGCDMATLILRHGLSSDEAALIFALHGGSGSVMETEAETESLDTWAGSE
ncbi:hypothetical protein [Granulosicoccus antarcticus]|uniref:DUF2802 domain-containing protein n=1 Tax=Granulosicoccus antarcticus IMCC3135 TaxID=1192854 RepID=A0A2Z2NKV6_9GAMM|nr:hypothetical protein [Granulosicoccus antarcticus]ASJ71789.1 hypothetical protein IMCC3135_08450 [Granulosicoccus antarcticus IMCC3135]